MTLKERISSPTPTFFKKIRNIGIILATVSAAILTAPVALPAILLQAAGYIGVGATVASAVSQTVTHEKTLKKRNGK